MTMTLDTQSIAIDIKSRHIIL